MNLKTKVLIAIAYRFFFHRSVETWRVVLFFFFYYNVLVDLNIKALIEIAYRFFFHRSVKTWRVVLFFSFTFISEECYCGGEFWSCPANSFRPRRGAKWVCGTAPKVADTVTLVNATFPFHSIITTTHYLALLSRWKNKNITCVTHLLGEICNLPPGP